MEVDKGRKKIKHQQQDRDGPDASIGGVDRWRPTSSSSSSSSSFFQTLKSARRSSLPAASHPKPQSVPLRSFLPDEGEWKTIITMATLSAPLGTSLDNYHGLFGVLEYNPSFSSIVMTTWWQEGQQIWLKTSLWTPALFAVAGAVMSYLTFRFDQIPWPNRLATSSSSSSSPSSSLPPPWPIIFCSIAFFSLQYYLSGLLDHEGVEVAVIHMVLASQAVLGLFAFDRSPSGLLLGLATAMAGPLVEIAVVNLTHAYHYVHADAFGVCSWIPWVYLMGAPAVGNLARAIKSLQKQSTAQ
eukprot:scaffold1091_cov164-Ochromonas_danica.AAC.23